MRPYKILKYTFFLLTFACNYINMWKKKLKFTNNFVFPLLSIWLIFSIKVFLKITEVLMHLLCMRMYVFVCARVRVRFYVVHVCAYLKEKFILAKCTVYDRCVRIERALVRVYVRGCVHVCN